MDGLTPDDVEAAITDKTILISLMHANNEIGTIQPIEAVGRIAHRHGIVFHTDAVQTFGHLPINVNDLGVDLLSASGHKLYGPKGVGILYIRKGTRIESFLQGGSQERGRRASTHNVPAIVGMGKATAIAAECAGTEGIRLAGLRDRLIRGILERVGYTRLNGHPSVRLPNNVNIAFEFVEGESLLIGLDMEDVACSAGSACMSSNVAASHVLTAIGLSPQLAQGSLRFSLGRGTTDAEIDYVIDILPDMVKKLRTASPSYKRQTTGGCGR